MLLYVEQIQHRSSGNGSLKVDAVGDIKTHPLTITWTKDSFITLDRDLLESVKKIDMLSPLFKFEFFKMDLDKLCLLSFTEDIDYLWHFRDGFMRKTLFVFEWQLFEKKVAKNKFLVLAKKARFFSISGFFC